MRLTIVTSGGEGDTRPLANLSKGLIDAGHDVCLFANSASLGFAQRMGVPAVALAGDIRAVLPSQHPSRELTSAEIGRATRDLVRFINDHTPLWMNAVADHARTADAVLFAGLARFIGQVVAVELQKPAIQLALQPLTHAPFPMPTCAPPVLPGWMNALSHRLSHQSFWRSHVRCIEQARRRTFGVRSPGRPAAPAAVLYGMSTHLAMREPAWPDSHHLCGPWTRQCRQWSAPNDLLDFLAAGEKPIAISFGSRSVFVRGRALRALIDAVDGRRAVFCPGWSYIEPRMLPSNFLQVRDVPHEWLFPHTSMVVHSGGAGTSHTAARAGVPSVVLPLSADQHFWAARLAAAGVAAPYIKDARLDAWQIRRMMDIAEQELVRQRARQLGAAMSLEDGVSAALRRIDSTIAEASVSAGYRHALLQGA